MKKICLFLLILIFPIFAHAEELNLAKNAKSAIMIETATGEILFIEFWRILIYLLTIFELEKIRKKIYKK